MSEWKSCLIKFIKMIAKNKIEDIVPDFEKGEVILIDKEKGITSFDVIRKLRKILKIKKIGHAGTLDPAATGLLILCTGKKTKEISSFQNKPKVYEGIITLGKSTPSMDGETEAVDVKDYSHVSENDIEKVRKEFIGEIEQIPPMYSAVKHKGKSLYKYARKGIEVERKPRKVTVYEFEITKINLPDVYFKIKCSKGTYVRVIANDFGEKLGCGGYLKELRRTGIGEFDVADAFTLKELSEIFSETKISDIEN